MTRTPLKTKLADADREDSGIVLLESNALGQRCDLLSPSPERPTGDEALRANELG